ncbi:hypothetical protein TanjilG_10098 [Lupinus angustifolius]|uniref:Uncharacterized protein n=1 Tax=Lupinus angustifolius TaxID=3871 RepID=A0A1J7HZ95_LUPAN|nr:hypothetical protein TanjilG_10098 [Lupinus angustifolius]
MVKPYTFTPKSLFSISISNSHHPLPSPFISIPLSNISIPHFPSQSRSYRSHQPIVCARKNRNNRPWSSNRNILQLASTIALNLKIFPEPFNSLITQIAESDLNQIHLILNPGKKTKNKDKSVWFVFVLSCAVAGFLSWRISEPDLFLKALLFCVAGFSLFRGLRLGKKAFKEWFLGFLFGIVLLMSTGFRLGKEDVKFWVHRIRTCSPIAQFVTPKRNRNWRISK